MILICYHRALQAYTLPVVYDDTTQHRAIGVCVYFPDTLNYINLLIQLFGKVTKQILLFLSDLCRQRTCTFIHITLRIYNTTQHRAMGVCVCFRHLKPQKLILTLLLFLNDRCSQQTCTFIHITRRIYNTTQHRDMGVSVYFIQLILF